LTLARCAPRVAAQAQQTPGGTKAKWLCSNRVGHGPTRGSSSSEDLALDLHAARGSSWSADDRDHHQDHPVGGVQDGWSIDVRDGSPNSDLLLWRRRRKLLPLADRVGTCVRSPDGKELDPLPRSASDSDPAEGNSDSDGNTNPKSQADPRAGPYPGVSLTDRARRLTSPLGLANPDPMQEQYWGKTVHIGTRWVGSV
jgi:hypothetical protein